LPIQQAGLAVIAARPRLGIGQRGQHLAARAGRMGRSMAGLGMPLGERPCR
jgi:hypothetical protein